MLTATQRRDIKQVMNRLQNMLLVLDDLAVTGDLPKSSNAIVYSSLKELAKQLNDIADNIVAENRTKN